MNAIVEVQKNVINKSLEEIHQADFKNVVDAMSEEEKIIVLKSIKKTEIIINEVLERVNRLEYRDGVMRKLFDIQADD